MKHIHKGALLFVLLMLAGGGCGFSVPRIGRQPAVPAVQQWNTSENGSTGDVGDASLCPEATAVKTFNSSANTFAKSGPYDVKKFSNAFAIEQPDGTVDIFISNQVYPSAKEFNDFKNSPYGKMPFKTKGDAMVKVALMNGGDPVGIGTYEFKNGPANPLYTSGALIIFDGTAANTIVMSPEKGNVFIVSKKDAVICGTFDIAGNGDSISGVFRAPLSKF